MHISSISSCYIRCSIRLIQHAIGFRPLLPHCLSYNKHFPSTIITISYGQIVGGTVYTGRRPFIT